MALRHDSQGFLQGDAIDIGRALTEWTGIRADVRAIRQALLGGRKIGRASSESPSSAPGNGAASRQPASPMPRDNLGRFVRRDSAPSGTGSARAESATPRQSAGRTPATPTPAGAPGAPASTTAQARADAQRLERNRSNAPNDPARRDASGKFVRADGTAPGEFGGQPDAENSGALRGFFDRLTDAVSGDSLEQADPAVKAFREVAQPLAAGYGMLTGNSEEKKKEGWFRRIYSSLSGFRKDESTFNKAANESLKTIEERPVSTEGSGSGFLGGLAGRFLPMLAMLFKGLLLPVAGAIAAWNVGRWIGEKLYAWMDEAGINTIIFDAFDGAKAYISKGWDGAVSEFKAMSEGIGKGWDAIASTFRSAYEGLKTLPVIGSAIRAAEKLATKAVEVVAPVVAGAKQGIKDVAAGVKQGYSGESQAGAGRGSINPPMAGGAGPLDTRSTATKAGQWVGGAAGSVGRLFKKGSNQQRALETGANYSAGNIGGLSDSQTRALVASTALTESGGGKLGIVNEAGYMGRYQAGAGWLADAGMINGGSKSVRDAMTKDGFTNEYKWGKSGGMTKFLKDDKNWTGGMNYQSYLGSAEAQDSAFKINSDAAYKSLMANPNIKDKSPENIAGLLKARHIAGMGGALQVAKGGTGAVDANGTSARKYYDDVAKDKDGFMGVYSGMATAPARAAGAPAQTAYATAPRVPAITAPPAIADAPPVVSPMATGSNGKPIVKVSMPAQDVGQDVKDWRVALIHTGGISSGGR